MKEYNLTIIKETLRKKLPEIKEKFGVKELYIFGSYVRGEQKKDSDIDIMVEFEKGKKTFNNYMDLKFFLEELFERKVDLVIKEAVKPKLKEYIYNEAVNVKERL